jgi:hypothetical protein
MSSKHEKETEGEGSAPEDKPQDYPTVEELSREERRIEGVWQVREGGHRFSDETYGFWKKKAGKELSPDQVRESIQNISRFFDLLASWDEAAKNQAKEGRNG